MYSKISSMLDNIANTLESKGFIKEAFELDKISNALDNDIRLQDKIDGSIIVTPEARAFIGDIKKLVAKRIGNSKVRVEIKKGPYTNSFDVSVIALYSTQPSTPSYTSDYWDSAAPELDREKFKETIKEDMLFSVLLDGGWDLSSPRISIHENYGRYGRYVDYRILDKLWYLLSGIKLPEHMNLNTEESPQV